MAYTFDIVWAQDDRAAQKNIHMYIYVYAYEIPVTLFQRTQKFFIHKKYKLHSTLSSQF